MVAGSFVSKGIHFPITRIVREKSPRGEKKGISGYKNSPLRGLFLYPDIT
jgi:hypothetical protein